MNCRKIFILVFLFFSFSSSSFAVEAIPEKLIPINSEPGVTLLNNSLNQNAIKLLSHFTTQKTVTYCGVASVVMILNSTNLVAPLDTQHTPYHYFNQEDFFTDQIKQIISPIEVEKKGIVLAKLYEIVQSFGLNTRVYYANELSLDSMRTTLKNALLNQQFIIVNFLRTGLGTLGGGHHSPIAAYDEQSDRFLILDVARYKYPSYWVKAEDLWRAINTKDGDSYRGFIIINP